MGFMIHMKVEEIFDYVTSEYEGIVIAENWGERGLFYNPDGKLPKGVYILTFKEKDGPNDNASNVNRPNVHRLNLGISKDTFKIMFGELPERPAAGSIVNTGHNFESLDKMMPHPVYGWMSWICVLNPSSNTFEKLKPLIHESIELAKVKYRKRVK